MFKNRKHTKQTYDNKDLLLFPKSNLSLLIILSIFSSPFSVIYYWYWYYYFRKLGLYCFGCF